MLPKAGKGLRKQHVLAEAGFRRNLFEQKIECVFWLTSSFFAKPVRQK